jgi:hypothetical protein|uniref:Uncharacterized protein n=1 Tax=Myoviridae sp. ctYA416 TaxID=2825125 RepID=A0A8S5UTB5_9CAUD|nr:MAG TPA: hypothetical protein [Myoviridae sp. ctYA416]
MQDIYYRYFVFSRTQLEDIKRREEKLGRYATIGKVIVDGIAKEYTDIILNMESAKYADSIIITEGDIRKITYVK